MKNPITSLLTFAIMGISILTNNVLAEDTDIYSRPASGTSASNPNILVIIDNSTNWAAASQGWQATPTCPAPCKQGQAELQSVATVTSELSSTVNVGLMMFTDGAVDGGYVRFDIRPMTDVSATANPAAAPKIALSKLIGTNACVDGPNALNGTPNCIYKNFASGPNAESVNAASVDYSAAMFEVFKYFGGYTSPEHARDDVAGSPVDTSHFGPTRYAGDPDHRTDPYAFTPLDTGPSTASNRIVYDSPIDSAASCAKNYVIFIGNGFPNQDAPSTLLSGVGGDVSQLPINDMTTSSAAPITSTDVIRVTNAGEYADIASCQAGAAATYAADYPAPDTDPAHATTFTCTLAATITAGDFYESSLGVTNCADYADNTACAASLPGRFPSYTSPWSCSVNTTGCIKNLASPLTMIANTGCISNNLNNGTTCSNYGSANWPEYSGFSCNAIANCTGSGKEWHITASKQIGSTHNQFGYTNTLTTSYKFTVSVTHTIITASASPTGTFSAPAASKLRYADEWARFLNKTDVNSAPGFQNITTFTIDVYKNQPDPDQSALLMSMARAGGGKYYVATNEDAIKKALRKIVSEIQAVNSVFASSSLPVSVNARGTYLNQVFMGMFRPDASAAPRWAGNLKQYKFAFFAGELKLADMNGNEAISSTTGFITPCASSYWNSDTGQYWDFPGTQAVGDCTAVTSAFPAGSDSIFSDGPDGEIVEKGGAAQHLRGVVSNGATLVSQTTKYRVCVSPETPETANCRKVLTCDGSSATSCTSLPNFEIGNGNITWSAMGLPVSTQRDNLINWTRGKDVDNENSNFWFDVSWWPVTQEVRPSVHGGVVHAQPAVIDYGGTRGVIAFYGADDGIFHSVNANQTGGGKELWSFIAPEHYQILHRLRDNGETTPRVDFPGALLPVEPKAYGFDGGIGVYQQGTTKVWIFPSMRRGGRAIYGFNVTNPATPTIMWRKGCFTTDNSLCSTGWTSIGQTWSRPEVTYLNGYVDGSGDYKPVLVFGGGYDTCEDTNSSTRCATTPRKGANIWFVDAQTGSIIRTYATNYSVPGDLSLLTNSLGIVTHLYAADTGGYVYRINVGDYDGTTFSGSWSVDTTTVSVNSPGSIAIANLSTSGNPRKFLSGPAVVRTGTFNAVLVGSGDREHPLVADYACNNYSGGVTNQFYMLIDIPNTYLTAATNANLVDVTTGTTAFDPATHTLTNDVGGTSTRGWRFDFGSCEQSVNRPLVIGGITYFGTNAPGAAPSACVANLGEARGYAVEYLTGSASTAKFGAGATRSGIFIGGGMPPSPVSGLVDIDGQKTPFCIGCIDPSGSNQAATQVRDPDLNPVGARFRSFWYIEND